MPPKRSGRPARKTARRTSRSSVHDEEPAAETPAVTSETPVVDNSQPPETEPTPTPAAAETVLEPPETPATADMLPEPPETPATAETVPEPHETPAAVEMVSEPSVTPTTAETVPEPPETPADIATTMVPETKNVTRTRRTVIRKVKKLVPKRVPKAAPLPAQQDLPVEPQNANPSVPSSAGDMDVDVPVTQEVEAENPNALAASVEKVSDVAVVVEVQSENPNASVAIEGENPNELPKDPAKKVPDEAEEEKKGEGELVDEEALVEAAAGVDAKEEVLDDEAGISERRRRRRTEIFIGGLDREAKEEEIREVFEKVGEVIEVRMMMDAQTGKNKGYAFLRYLSPESAKRAVAEFAKVMVHGKLCGAAALEGNDTIFLGNIDKKWKKEDVLKLLKDIGIENIDTVTVMTNPANADANRGFAFLELQTNKDAKNAYKKLQKKDAFGKGRNIKVAWAEPLNEPDEEEMSKVKTVYTEGLPSSWDEEKVREHFKKFGEIERVVLARDMQSAKRKDFAFVNYTSREAALSCVQSFNKELVDEGSKVNLKVSLAKPLSKSKNKKIGVKTNGKDSSKEKSKLKTAQRDAKINIPYNPGKINVSYNSGKNFRGVPVHSGGARSSTNHELLQVLREQATWNQGSTVARMGPPPALDYSYGSHGVKRPYSTLGDSMPYSDPRGYPRARMDAIHPVAGSSYSSSIYGMAGPSSSYYHQPTAGYGTGTPYGSSDPSTRFQMRQGPPPYGSDLYRR
ncbi:hypothetical protein QJS04_geneDACA009417 [Acorus gramineus]|uniref:RRM domain-containing protein n=1 Tax=Acorus gramineus TaxID=55184 RepID=A0AAV9AHD0_ACOGR|nr:hypothetical protein QJS04_geneDACA009417 [Acorus gramineus]